MLYSILLGLDAILAVVLITLILVQRGRGAEVGAAFGAGASASIFGARGVVSFLTKVVAVLATVFLLNSLLLAYLANRDFAEQSVIERSAEEKSAVKQEIESELETLVPDTEKGKTGDETLTGAGAYTTPSTVPEVPD